MTLLLCGSVTVFAQTVIKGTITDSKDGSPIVGATIKVRGENTSVASAADGSFEIVAKSGKVLDISEIGHFSQTISFQGKGILEIKLAPDLKALSEVIVTGTGSAVSKKKLAFAVQSVNISDQTKVPTGDVGQQLVGQIAGAQISSTNGQPGAAINILLRGINSISAGTTPMILIDGIQLGATDLGSIDLNSIEKVEVVQGAAAATIYGAQGANGVIQLFSKKGKQGALSIDASSSITSSEFLNIGDVHKNRFHNYQTNAAGQVVGASGNPLEWDPVLGLYKENVIYNALDPTGKSDKPFDQNLKYYDHFKMFFQQANTYNASVNVSGGRDKFDFSISASKFRQESNFKDNGYLDRNNFTVNLGMELAKNLKLRSLTQLVYAKKTVNWDRSIVYAINNSRPFANYDDKMADGNVSHYFGDATGVNGENPAYYQAYTSTDEQKVDVVQNFDLNYKPFRFIELDVKYGLNYRKGDNTYKYLNQSGNKNVVESDYSLANFNSAGGGNDGEINIQRTQTVFQNFLPSATINLDFAKDFHLRVPIKSTTYAAFDYRKNVFKDYYVYGLGQPPFTPYTASNYTTQVIYRDEITPFITYGFLVNQRFEYGELGGVSGGLRQDYSSAFGRGITPKLFPRGDAYLRISSFNFWNNLGNIANVLAEWKLRAAYGEAGIQPGAFDRYPTLKPKTYGGSQAFYFEPLQPNPDLDVEVSKELELGTDLTFKAGKNNWFRTIGLSFSYWKRSTDNAIYNVDIAPSLGGGTFKQNAFTLASNGTQFSINLATLSSKKLNWNTTINWGHQTSEISKVIGADVVLISSAGSTNYVLKPGLKIGQLFGYKFLHQVDALNAAGDFIIAKADQGNYEVASNGFVVDKASKRPVVDPQQHDFGDPNPKFNMSMINDLAFGNFFTFSMQWDWVYGSHLYNQTKEWMYRDGISGDNEKQITINGETGAWTAFYRGVYQAGANNGTKDYFYEDASFARLRNISIGFDIAKFHPIKGFRKIQLVLSGRNLITITNYTGFDPEISSGTTNSAWDRGTDHNTLPNLKYYTVGLNFGF
ncbi:MAG: SusC/RagA family TonB-linked outer membrane protein [Ferruginibacter sp.]